jgi:hypothetical protein
VQLTVDDVDFLPQLVEVWGVHKSGKSCAGEAILRSLGPCKGQEVSVLCDWSACVFAVTSL